jgi:hypothetical protein
LLTRRGLQIVLGLLWLCDAALQFQPFMFGPGFASDVLGGAADGQASAVSAMVNWVARVVGAHPLPWNAVFATVELFIAVGLLWWRTATAALGASIVWALSIWVFGEGFGGLTGDGATLLAGAPGAALLYAVLACAAWPAAYGRRVLAIPRWVPFAWAAYWMCGAILQAVNGPHTGPDLAAAVAAAASASPHWMGDIDITLATYAAHISGAAVNSLIAVQALIGFAGLVRGWVRAVAAIVGAIAALCLWSLGEGFGEIASGQATDVGVGLLVTVLAVALVSTSQDNRTTASPALRFQGDNSGYRSGPPRA